MTVQTIVFLFLISMVFAPQRAGAQQTTHYSRKQLRLLVGIARNEHDYRKLASYFRYQEMAFRTKAQKALDEYALDGWRLPLATKFVTRSEALARLRRHYLVKADENAKLAQHYNEMLTDLGAAPGSESATVVSVKSLQNAPASLPQNRF